MPVNIGRALALAVSVVASLFSSAATAQTDAPEVRPNPHLLVTGLFTTGVAYTPAIVVAMTSPRPEDQYLYAPLAGPWLDLVNRDRDGDTDLNRTLLVLDGVVQAIGALEVVASFMFADKSNAATVETDAFTAHFVPTRLGADGYGVSARGKF